MAIADSPRLEKAKAKAHELAAQNGLPYQVFEQESGKLVVMVAKPGTEEGGPVQYVAYPEATVDDDSVIEVDTETAYAQGAAAQAAGQKMADCPYPQTSESHDPWMRGYAEAKLNAAPPSKAAAKATAAPAKAPAKTAKAAAKAVVDEDDDVTILSTDAQRMAANGQQRCAGCRLPFSVKVLNADGHCKVCAKKEAKGEPIEPNPVALAAEMAENGEEAVSDEEVAAMFGAKSAAALVAEASDEDDDDDEEIEVVAAPPASKSKAKAAPPPAPAKAPAKAAAKPAPAPAPKAAAKNGTSKAAKGEAKVVNPDTTTDAPTIKDPTKVPGFVIEGKPRVTGMAQQCYQVTGAKGNPFDPDLGKFVVTCQHTAAYFPSKAAAYIGWRTPQEWCEDCATVAANR